MVYNPAVLGLDVIRYMGNECLVKCILPNHNDTKPSASFNMQNGKYYCFACRWGLLADAIAKITGGYVEKIDSTRLPQTKKSEKDFNWILQSPIAVDNRYIAKRLGLNRQQVNEMCQYFKIRDIGIGVAFVLKDAQGKPVAVNIRKYSGEPRYILLGNKPFIYPFEHLHKGVYVTEGVMGVLNAYKYGVKAVCTNSAGFGNETVKFLSNFNPVIVFDNDRTGKAATEKMLLNGATTVLRPFIADECNWSDLVQSPKTNNIKEFRNVRN